MRHLILVIALSVFVVSCSKKPDFNGWVSSPNGDIKKDWVVKVGDLVISKKDFADEFKQRVALSGLPEDQMKTLLADPDKRKDYLDRMSQEYQVLAAARKENVFTNADFEIFARSMMRQVILQYYQNAVLSREVTVSEEDVAAFYEQNKQQIPTLNSEIESQIRQMIRGQKVQEISQNRLDAKIEYNNKADVFTEDLP